MSAGWIFAPVLSPVLAAVVLLLLPRRSGWIREAVLLLGTASAFVFAAVLSGGDMGFSLPWLQLGSIRVDFSLRLYGMSSFIVLASSAISTLTALYSAVFMKRHKAAKGFYAYMLLTLGFVNGAVLSDSVVLMLFFWEGLLVTLFAMILTGGRKASATAVKALAINGAADLCLMAGIILLISATGASSMRQMHLEAGGASGTAAFVLMMIGATAKAGSMPFHSWIPDAALDAPLPFMALLPAALEKLLGIYLLTRVSLDLFSITPGSPMSLLMMIVGAVTILLAVMMALIQKDYKRLLSYHAISQVGYMILGIGTALPAGIVGGLFHMVNNALYKSALFMTGGAVEYRTGTTDLRRLGGLGRKMPLTFACFLVTAAAISGIPPLNGFFSKELVFGAALDTHIVFYIAALAGAFFTAASFLKLGHAAWLGKPGEKAESAKEAPWPMLVPMVILAAFCVLFGVYSALPLKGFIEPALGPSAGGESFSGHVDPLLTGISAIVLVLAFLNHLYGVKKTKKGLQAVDHIHYAPGLKQVYALAERRFFDPYVIAGFIVKPLARAFMAVDRGIDWLYGGFSVWLLTTASKGVRRAHTGSHWLYIAWILGGLALVSLLIAALA
jgi:formate hydrogenlyase subunit 3/multisubunit Na+/H+ antiporter MnhD subunit